MNFNTEKWMVNMTFSEVYQQYRTVAEKKGPTRDQLHQVIEWLKCCHGIKLKEI